MRRKHFDGDRALRSENIARHQNHMGFVHHYGHSAAAYFERERIGGEVVDVAEQRGRGDGVGSRVDGGRVGVGVRAAGAGGDETGARDDEANRRSCGFLMAANG